MNLLNTLSTPAWSHLIAALLHTLWLGMLSAVAVALVLRAQPANLPQQRQLACIAGLLATLIGGYMAWSLIDQGSTATSHSVPTTAIGNHPAATTIDERPAAPSQPVAYHYLPAKDNFSSQPAIHATTWAVIGWLLGVAAMLARMLRAMAGAGRLRRRAQPLPPNHLLNQILSELQSRLGSAQKAAILLVDTLSGPAVTGALRPVILWPVAWATGLPEWQVRAMLAHEFAHIVRRDYLVNLLQMVVEALLFFNPAVWWMSRQLRIEREACCDALAARLLGEAGEYNVARALAEVSGALPTGVLAFGSDQHGSLLGRVRRLLEPGHRPNLRLPWPTLLGLLALIAIALVAIKSTGDAVASKLMSHKERIATMEALKEQAPDYQHGDAELEKYTKKDRITIEGSIRMADGGKIPQDLQITSCSTLPRRIVYGGGISGTQMNAEKTQMTFALPVEFGAIHLLLKAEGYAPQFIGPLTADPGGTVEGVELVLDRGFKSDILLKDGHGNPIPDAEIQIQSEDPSQGWRLTATTGKDGVAAIEHTPNIPVKLEVRHPGYMEAITQHVVLLEGKPYKWTLEKASPATGQVVDAEHGNPLGGVEFHMQERRSSRLGNMQWQLSSGPFLGTSDAHGRFSIDTLDATSTYKIVAQSPDRSHAGMFALFPGETGKLVKLQPTLSISGVIANAEKLTRNRDGSIELAWGESLRYELGYVFLNGDVDVRENGTNTTFMLHGALPGRIEIRGSGLREVLALRGSTTNIVLNNEINGSSPKDLQAQIDAEHPMRTIHIQLQPPKGAPIPSGSIQVKYHRYEAHPELKEGFMRIGRRVSLPLDENGAATFEIPTPNRLKLKPQGLNGYWFPSHWNDNGTNVCAGGDIGTYDASYEQTLPVLPAGAIEGSIFDQQGKPAKGLLISISASGQPDADISNSLGIEIKNSASGSDDSSRFLAGPLPLDDAYRIIAHTGQYYTVSKPIRLTAEQPFAQLEIKMPETVDLIGFVTGPEDEPIKGVVADLSLSVEGHGYGTDNQPLTGVDGRFSIAGLNPALPEGANYTLLLMPASNYVPVSIKFNAVKNPLRFSLERGRTVTGIVVDQSTGKPLQGVEVYARGDWENWSSDNPGWINADALTDDQGRFRFTRLRPNRPYAISTRSGWESVNYPLPADATPDICISIKPYPWWLDEHPQD